jgi:SAM-dependent methyltransferase
MPHLFWGKRNAMHVNSRLLFAKYAVPYFDPSKRVLEIGPSGIPSVYKMAVGGRAGVWDTLEVKEGPQFTYGGVMDYSYPITDETYDIVVSGQVLEHVKKIWVWIKEVARLCKTGGIVIIISPVGYPYHGPVDCWRVFPEGMEALYEEAGLEVIMSNCESLEIPGYRRYWPRWSFQDLSWPQQLATRMLGTFGFPVVCAFDTITIGRKRVAPAGSAGETRGRSGERQ